MKVKATTCCSNFKIREIKDEILTACNVKYVHLGLSVDFEKRWRSCGGLLYVCGVVLLPLVRILPVFKAFLDHSVTYVERCRGFLSRNGVDLAAYPVVVEALLPVVQSHHCDQ